MPLDIYNLNTNEHIFALNDDLYDLLFSAFEHHYQQTGLFIDQYGDLTLDINQQKELLDSVSHYLSAQTTIKQNNKPLMEFLELLNDCIRNNIVIRFLGD